MHLCRAPLDRLAMCQQHFLPMLESCSHPHLLLPRGLFAQPSPGPQTLESVNVSQMARNPSMSPLPQRGSSTQELMPDSLAWCTPMYPGRLKSSDTGKESQMPTRAKSLSFLVFFFFSVLRCNSHTIKFTIIKCTIQWLLVYSQDCTTVFTI